LTEDGDSEINIFYFY